MAKATTQKTIGTYGNYGRTVRVFRQGDLYRVQCRADRMTKSFRGEGAKVKAVAFAKRYADGVMHQPDARVTVGELWQAYIESQDYTQLRPRTRAYYEEAWGLFTDVVPEQRPADEVDALVLDKVRKALETTPRKRTKRGLAISTMQRMFGVVKVVFGWGEKMGKVTRNRVHAFRFKVASDRRPESPDEYTAEEFRALLEAFTFDRLDQRTPLCILALVGYQGIRINAAVHLRWEDVAWDDDVLIWRARWDKTAREWEQPMRAPTRAILARLWDVAGHPGKGWVFPAKRKDSTNPVYGVGSFLNALAAAEVRAGVAHRTQRGAHGFRRMVAGDVVDLTGSDRAAMEAIGDRSVRMAEKYVKRRRQRSASALRALDEEAG